MTKPGREKGPDRGVRFREIRVGRIDADGADYGADRSGLPALLADVADELIDEVADAAAPRRASLPPQPQEVLGREGQRDGLLAHTMIIR